VPRLSVALTRAVVLPHPAIVLFQAHPQLALRAADRGGLLRIFNFLADVVVDVEIGLAIRIKTP